LSINVQDPEAPQSPDNVSKVSDTTTVVIHESPRGIANEAFEDDEDTVDCKKQNIPESPSNSTCKDKTNVSYSSSDSTINMPEVDIDAAIRKKLESEQVRDGQLKKKWRGEKLYLAFPQRDQKHMRRFCWWMIVLLLLAGAITVAALWSWYHQASLTEI